jgi:hypothetical protein
MKSKGRIGNKQGMRLEDKRKRKKNEGRKGKLNKKTEEE